MAREQATVVSSDLDSRQPATTEVTFSIGGVGYQLHLTSDQYDGLMGALYPYIRFAKKLGRNTTTYTRPVVQDPRHFQAALTRAGLTPVPATTPSTPQALNQSIRTWAAIQGLPLAGHGRIPGDIVAAYFTANPSHQPR